MQKLTRNDRQPHRPRDWCAWSPEIARKRTREMERDRQALTAIIGGLLVLILVIAAAM